MWRTKLQLIISQTLSLGLYRSFCCFYTCFIQHMKKSRRRRKRRRKSDPDWPQISSEDFN